MKYIYALLFFVFCGFWSFCQSVHQKNVEVANAYLEIEAFANALEYYERAYNLKKSKILAKKIAYCALKIQKYNKAVKWYSSVCGAECKDLDPLVNYAKALKCTGNFDMAEIQYRRYLAKLTDTNKEPSFLSSLDSSRKWLRYPLKNIEVINLKNVNSEYSDINPTFYGEGIVFSSSRESVIIKTRDGQSDEPYFNLYRADTNKRGYWKKPVRFSSNLNTFDHEGAIAFSEDQETAYLTRGTHKEYNKTQDDGTNYLKLFKSVYNGIGWSKPEYFMLNDSLSSFGHPAIGYHDQIFIFASDMEGGYGGTDLYVTFKLDSGWKEPMNLGPKVNTAGNELYPFILDDGTLYFTSNGHIGLGGFDLYKSELFGGEWGKPINLRCPINTSYDDFSLVIDQDLKNGFFSSNRPKGMGKEDVYKLIFR